VSPPNAELRSTPATDDKRPRPGGRSARVRAAVLDATAHVLAERGYDRLSVEDVAAAAGVHKTSIYRRWPTKPDLVLDAMLTRSDSVIAMPDTGRLDADILAFLRGVASNVTSPLGHALLLATLRTDDEQPEDHSLRRRFWDERFARATARLERAKKSGELPADTDTALLLEALVSPIHFRALVTGARIDDRFLRSVTRLVGIAPTRARQRV
jgi:AcrR family transcriptional regulator